MVYNEFLVSGMPPPVGHRPGITPFSQVPPATNVLSGPVISAASAQPDVTKPLFPSAGQVKHNLPMCYFLLNTLLLNNKVSRCLGTDRLI